MFIMVNLPFDQGVLIISQFLLCMCFFADKFEERERVQRRISASFGARSEYFRPCDEENYSLRVKDGLSFRGFVKYCLVHLCIICRKIKVNKHCEIFHFSFGCLKRC
jgi:hypothetical protein